MGVEDWRKIKWGRPGTIHHVSGHKVDMGGRGQNSKYVHTKQKASFLLVRRVVSIMLRSGVRNCSRVLE